MNNIFWGKFKKLYKIIQIFIFLFCKIVPFKIISLFLVFKFAILILLDNVLN